MGRVMQEAISEIRSILKEGITRRVFRNERSMIRRFGPSFLGTTNRREKWRGWGVKISRIILLDRRPGRNSLMAGSWESAGRRWEGGERESGGRVWNCRASPSVIIWVATGSPRLSQWLLRGERYSSHSSSSFDFSHEKTADQRRASCFCSNSLSTFCWNYQWAIRPWFSLFCCYYAGAWLDRCQKAYLKIIQNFFFDSAKIQD